MTPPIFSRHRVSVSPVTAWRRGIVAAMVVCLGLVLPVPAMADEMPRHRLDFEVEKTLPAACKERLDLLAILTAWIKPSVFLPPASRVLSIRLGRLPDGGKTTEVVIRGEDGTELGSERHEHEPTKECHKVLFWAAYDAAALMGRFKPPEVVKGAPPEESSKSSSPQPTAVPCAPVAPVEKEEPKEKEEEPGVRPGDVAIERRFFVGAGVSAFLNVSPEPFFAPRVGLGWRALPKATLLLDVAGWGGMRVNPKDGPTLADVTVLMSTLAGCYAPASLMLCVVVSGGKLHAEGIGGTFAASSTPWFLGVGGRGAFEYSVPSILGGRLAFRGDIDVIVNVRPAGLYGYAGRLAWEPPLVGGSLATSAIWKF